MYSNKTESTLLLLTSHPCFRLHYILLQVIFYIQEILTVSFSSRLSYSVFH